jgi:hypothetical protein
MSSIFSYLAFMLTGVLFLLMMIRLANTKHGWLWVSLVIVAIIFVLYNIGSVAQHRGYP